MRLRMSQFLIGSLPLALLAAASICDRAGAMDDDTAARFLVAPGRYVLFNCQQLVIQENENQKRMRELEALMAKSGNEFVNAMAYRPEYLQLRGEMADMRHEAADKKCKTIPGARPRPTGGAVIR
jgi:hypothetical protein